MRDNSDVDLAVSGLPPENFFKALSAVSSLLSFLQMLGMEDLGGDSLSLLL